ncbi:MAG TPA: GlsB/YeaQ/YmgE family stress response membrane protein [Xanthobacteraceae bacterium]|nr:GlsB/YeaQ/YmgE family stress response membrane protein [Xanthobacteraceae bacterium]
MGIFAWIVVGLIAGWLAAKITDAPQGLLRNLAVGLVGAILGGFMFDRLGIQLMPSFFGGLLTATIGAIVFLLIWQAIRRA